jgi:hypothetical protein
MPFQQSIIKAPKKSDQGVCGSCGKVQKDVNSIVLWASNDATYVLVTISEVPQVS